MKNSTMSKSATTHTHIDNVSDHYPATEYRNLHCHGWTPIRLPLGLPNMCQDFVTVSIPGLLHHFPCKQTSNDKISQEAFAVIL